MYASRVGTRPVTVRIFSKIDRMGGGAVVYPSNMQRSDIYSSSKVWYAVRMMMAQTVRG